ncbi:MAG: hypothetical protein CVV06_16960, partial [Gammaproteobacteria bacterium HGW-Gammaproteobacteria-10]
GMNADFALRHGWRVLGQCRSNCRGAKICPAADARRSSNRTLSGTGIFVAELFHIEKLDNESKFTIFHSN